MHTNSAACPSLNMTTTQHLEQTIGKCEPMRPAWFRIPDACAVSGIGRSLLYRHLVSGCIKSVCLRDRNSARGIRLVNADSLFAFIESFGQAAPPTGGQETGTAGPPARDRIRIFHKGKQQ
jgi:hypothetical protein